MPKVEWLGKNLPTVVLLPEVKRDMEIICQEAGTDEVGWLGLVSRDPEENTFIVYKILPLPKQEVHATTTEMTPEGLAELMMELIDSGELTATQANDIRFWGHKRRDVA